MVLYTLSITAIMMGLGVLTKKYGGRIRTFIRDVWISYLKQQQQQNDIEMDRMDGTQPSSPNAPEEEDAPPWQWPLPPPSTAPKEEHVLSWPQTLPPAHTAPKETLPHLLTLPPPEQEDPMYKYLNCMTSTPWINPLLDSTSTQAFSSFANQSAIPVVDTNNAQQEMDQSDMWLHDHAEKQEDHFSPPQNKQYSLQQENYEIPQCYRREIIADIHSPLCHIHIEHGASGDQASVLILGDDTLTEQNVANNTVVKKPHAGNSGAAAGAGATAAAAASMTDVE